MDVSDAHEPGPAADEPSSVALQSKQGMKDLERSPSHNICYSKSVLQEAGLYSCKRKIEALEQELRRAREQPFSFTCISSSSSLVCHYTGLPSVDSFKTLLGLCLRFDILQGMEYAVN